MSNIFEDYMDEDVAYLSGLIMARGTFSETQGIRQLVIPFSFSSVEIEGPESTFQQKNEFRLSLDDIRNRLQILLDTEIESSVKDREIDFVIKFNKNSMIWRNLRLIFSKRESYPFFPVPDVFFRPDLPTEWKREFLRGYADAAGNIRRANNYMNIRNRVRLDVLNYPTNWGVGVQLCRLLQDHLDVPVQNIIWGHPNMNRDFREHQINIFVVPFLKIGFSIAFKQKLLEEFADEDMKAPTKFRYVPCPGKKRVGASRKPKHSGEEDEEKLDPRLVGKHFNKYWQICQSLGCKKKKPVNPTSK
jgi:hypothetical protein